MAERRQGRPGNDAGRAPGVENVFVDAKSGERLVGDHGSTTGLAEAAWTHH